MIMAQHPAQQTTQSNNTAASNGAITATTTTSNQLDPTIARQHRKQLKENTNNIAANKFGANAQNVRATTSSTSKQPPTTIHEEISSKPHQHLSNSNEETNKESLRQLQDGKRTLIKNQLYLIEQLQLENANLRNERDQLQLENEELKFQLQMIR
jgi:hypothetical protein